MSSGQTGPWPFLNAGKQSQASVAPVASQILRTSQTFMHSRGGLIKRGQKVRKCFTTKDFTYCLTARGVCPRGPAG